ncbi:MAG: ATP-binding protein [Planctomycetes bacterium]|nr:ATP-binding protein [Planctomycetota bacterium]
MHYHPRRLAETLARAASTFPAVLVTGPRQSGKTTLLRHSFENHTYLSLERPDLREGAVADPVQFFSQNRPPLVLDEIQHAPSLLPFIQERIDAERTPGNWILSGSQSFPLMKGISESLAGRIAVLTLHPIAHEEAVGFEAGVGIDEILECVFSAEGTGPAPSGAPLDLADWLLRGGYPEPRFNPDVDRQLWCSSYVQTYLQRDVRDLLSVGDLSSFTGFIQLCAARSGGILNMADLARDAGVSSPTSKRWLSVLQASHLIELVRPYHANYGKRITRSPKLYFLDTGLLTFLLGLHQREALLKGPSLGQVFETAVVAEWVKAFAHRGEPASLYFHRSPGFEVDLIVERNQRLYGIEVKATSTPVPRHANSLRKWLCLAGDRARGVVACAIDRPAPIGPGVRAVPWCLCR